MFVAGNTAVRVVSQCDDKRHQPRTYRHTEHTTLPAHRTMWEPKIRSIHSCPGGNHGMYRNVFLAKSLVKESAQLHTTAVRNYLSDGLTPDQSKASRCSYDCPGSSSAAIERLKDMYPTLLFEYTCRLTPQGRARSRFRVSER